MNLWMGALSLAAAALAAPASAEGDLALKPIKLDDFVIGMGEAGYGVSKKDYELVTSKAYRLLIKSTGAKKCAWVAPELTTSIWLRKVEAGGGEIKATMLNEIEFEKVGEAEIFSVPVRTESFAWRCKGLEGRGVQGKFVVK